MAFLRFTQTLNAYTLYNEVYRLTIKRMSKVPKQATTNLPFQKWEQQLRKGLLSFLVLKELARSRHYGYSLMAVLRRTLKAEMAEGTIYPLLSRLQRDGLIESEWEIQESGPARKYYQITETGARLLEQMNTHWQHVNLQISKKND